LPIVQFSHPFGAVKITVGTIIEKLPDLPSYEGVVLSFTRIFTWLDNLLETLAQL
jgi:hypothetical protein